MNMDSLDKKKIIPLIRSFTYAITGILTALKSERNMRIHAISSVVVLFFSYFFSITKIEWLFVLISIGGMFALELMNTAIERVVDLATLEYHPLAKQAKDLAAGAVFVYAILSVIIGIVIFLPYLFSLF
ncbi:diacylglycerol kinase family protein [Paenibacillus sp. BSR1-1]|uniref:diacylglycerol kinase family protein n=1 Tax=Paenibacillus sp. BSR1-1 TaxID=3020845 RepID=UPI0025AF0607|nr:diacylglycerol kinase family protein [Paenibacillus sp. BSR1-1]MDN3018571.1 diacylglycerol kinase family protein [Paenibacillus sp. BSR1-1]